MQASTRQMESQEPWFATYMIWMVATLGWEEKTIMRWILIGRIRKIKDYCWHFSFARNPSEYRRSPIKLRKSWTLPSRRLYFHKPSGRSANLTHVLVLGDCKKVLLGLDPTMDTMAMRTRIMGSFCVWWNKVYFNERRYGRKPAYQIGSPIFDRSFSPIPLL